MLSQIVRPMVRTQIRLLASTQATRSTLVNTIAQWLSFLGVRAKVTQIQTDSDRIQVSIVVGKPEACDDRDWDRILQNLQQPESQPLPTGGTALTEGQARKLQRLLAYMVQVGNPKGYSWESLGPQLAQLGFETEMQLGIKAALKVPQSLDQLTEGLDPDVAAIALPKAVGIALLDRQVNPEEDRALATLLKAIGHESPDRSRS